MKAHEDNSSVKINTDSDTIIAKLTGVGEILSKSIVAYRNNNGFFRNPDDLIKVEGISPQLAMKISSQIDWQIPEQQEETTDRSIGFFVFYLIGALLSLRHFISVRIPDIMQSVDVVKHGNYYLWPWVWIYLSLGLLSLIGVLIFLNASIVSFTRRKETTKFCFRNYLYLSVAVLVSLASTALGNFVYFQFYSPDGWLPFLIPTNIASASLGLVAFFLITPILLFVFVKATRGFRKILAQIYDIAFLVSSLLNVIVSITVDFHSSIALKIFNIAMGAVYIFIGLEMVIHNSSIFDTMIAFYQQVNNKEDDSRMFWTWWINARIPNPEDQKKLRETLDTIYPKSRVKTIFGWLILGAGGWLIGTVVSSAIDWIVQRGLDNIFP